MKWLKKRKQKSFDEIAAKEMHGLSPIDNFVIALLRNGYSKEIALKEARRRVRLSSPE